MTGRSTVPILAQPNQLLDLVIVPLQIERLFLPMCYNEKVEPEQNGVEMDVGFNILQ